MIYGSVCSGIEAATVAWHPLGWSPAWFSEIEPFPCRLLAHYYPKTPNLGDMRRLESNPIFNGSTIDLLVGGTPCQSFSTAGLRAGLASDNGNLALIFCRILATKRPRWFVWENVPGIFSSSGGADFQSILRGFSQCGYSIAWRVLDAQFFGVPQRRRRVFVVGYLGNDWRPPAAVLFEPEGLRRDTAEGGKQRPTTSSSLTRRPYADNQCSEEKLIVHTLGKQSSVTEDGRGRGLPIVPCWWDGNQISQTLDRVLAKGQMMPEKNRFATILMDRPKGFTIHGTDGRASVASETEISSCLRSRAPGQVENSTTTIVASSLMVRRITPLEAERLQGFPDNYTNIPGAKDTPRYESIGNSMAVPVMRRIGERILLVDKILESITY